ncbi:MAG: proprotein convertase P-domain-containing protein [bacterium]
MLKKLIPILSVAALLAATACVDTSNNNDEGKPEDEGKVVDGKTDAWNPTNNPERFRLNFKYNYEELSQYGEGWAEQTPWPSDYWSYYEDSTNVRYHGSNVLSPMEKYDQAFNDWTPNMDLLPLDVHADCSSTYDGTMEDTRDEYYNHLGPAATWQHRNKGNYRARNKIDDDGDGKIDECGGDDYDGIETWWGLCHAWVPAAILEPEPVKDVTINGVTFTVSDIKALLITMYDRNSSVMIGGRCNEKEIERNEETGEVVLSECGDTNAGTWHVVAVNMLGIMKRAFAEDRTANYQVWNQPVRGFEIRSQNEVSESEALVLLGRDATAIYVDQFDSPEAVRWVHVDMTSHYVTESSNTTEGPLVPNIQQYTRQDHYEYILEINAAGDIVGGEWLPNYYNSHPDFLWLPIAQSSGNPSVSFAKVKHILDLSIKDDAPAPDDSVDSFENTAALAVPDNNAAGVSSTINVPDDIAIGSLKVELNVEHTYIGDLRITLSKGDTTVVLHDRQGGGADNLNKTFSVTELDGSSAQGEWTLHISDHAGQDTGQLLSWTLHVAGSNLPLSDTRKWSDETQVSITDNDAAGVSRTMTLGDDGTIKGIKVTVDITHPYVGDLIVTVSKDANQQVLQSREGGSADDLKKTFTLTSFNGAPIAGDWVLTVSDNAGQDVGTLNSWTLEAEL